MKEIARWRSTRHFGTFHQTNNQFNFGDHTERFAYFGSVNGNRSDYGLETPGPDVLHDRVWGLGGFGSLIYNVDPANQLRFVTSLRRDDYQVPNDPDAADAGVRDVERERDVLADFTWAHTLFARVCCLRCRLSCISIAPTTMAIRTMRRSARRSIWIRRMPARRSL